MKSFKFEIGRMRGKNQFSLILLIIFFIGTKANSFVPTNACQLDEYICKEKDFVYTPPSPEGTLDPMEACEIKLQRANVEQQPMGTYWTGPITIETSPGIPESNRHCMGYRYWSNSGQFYHSGPFGDIVIKYSCPTAQPGGLRLEGTAISADAGTPRMMCVYKPICTGRSVFDEATNSCVLCQAPFTFGQNNSICEARCQTGQSWDNITRSCIDPPKEQSCKTQSANPIDFIEGEKFRAEPVISIPGNAKIEFTYYYNNQKNREKTPSATIPSAATMSTGNFSSVDTYVAATTPPISASEYQITYDNLGLPKNSPSVLPNQHYGALDQYWRHNFDEVLQIQAGEYVLHLPKGQSIRFAGLGYNAIYPHLNLQLITAGEEAFAGFKLTDLNTNTVKKFDSTGRLIKIERATKDVLTLTYDTQKRLHRVTHNNGSYLQLAYEEKPTNSIYSLVPSKHSYPISVASSTGEVAQLTWASAYKGQTATFHLLKQKTTPANNTATSARTYEYNDPRWPASMTDIYDVTNIQTNTRTLFAHFDYDDKGRAINSELANGFERVQVNYVADNERVVTNALGKNATYNFADFNGVKRLQSVIGEATNSCVESNTSYTYYPEGNIETKTTNGVVTRYEYNSNNQKILEVTALGTSVEHIQKTCWHPTLNKVERIIEPKSVTIFSYFSSGQIKSKKVGPRTSANEACQ